MILCIMQEKKSENIYFCISFSKKLNLVRNNCIELGNDSHFVYCCIHFLDARNVVHLQFNKYDDFYLAFDTYELKYNFLKSLKLAGELAVQS